MGKSSGGAELSRQKRFDDAGQGNYSQDDAVLHFGLGPLATVADVRVWWRGGERGGDPDEEVSDSSVNQVIEIERMDGGCDGDPRIAAADGGKRLIRPRP
ncbi:MAG: hypothetical protein CME06_00390 [Gemmatimonadetes bacterium]|nr:hypothetical protein [Gemmatimonadota bacterium]